jgi:hypothetical protein
MNELALFAGAGGGILGGHLLGWGKQQSKSIEEKNGTMANTIEFKTQRQSKNKRKPTERINSASWWEIEPNVGRVANGVAAGMDRLKAIGNGQVPLCAATAWRLLNERL